MKKFFASLVVFLALGSSAAFADCKEADVQAKGALFQAKLIELAEKEPQRMIELNAEIQERLRELQNLATLDLLCKFYDEMLIKMN